VPLRRRGHEPLRRRLFAPRGEARDARGHGTVPGPRLRARAPLPPWLAAGQRSPPALSHFARRSDAGAHVLPPAGAGSLMMGRPHSEGREIPMTTHPVLIAGAWRPARATGTFTAFNPALGEPLPGEFPISEWADCDAALDAATAAAAHLRTVPPETRALFLEAFARRIEVRKDELVETAHAETGLPKAPRLAEVELPRTTGQLRQGAAAVRDGSWALPTIDTKLNIRSLLAPIGPVLVFGPNNFPFAFNSVAGGDFVAAIAAGNPVIAKANTSHPGTTRLLAELALEAARAAVLPPGMVQLLYRTPPDVGFVLVSDPHVAATGFTGSKNAGLKLKEAADRAGKPIYLEMSSTNPVFVLPRALDER